MKTLTKGWFVFFALLLPIIGFSQAQTDTLSKKQIRKARPYYINIGLGAGLSSLRDFATSPLIYGGITSNYAGGLERRDTKREMQLGVLTSIAALSANVDGEGVGNSSLTSINFYYTQLYELPNFTTDKVNVKVGGTVMSRWNMRTNEMLQNNGLGLEGITTLFASAKATKDISRKQEVAKKFLFIKYKKKPVDRFLSFQLNLAAMNSTYRNGFIYNNQSALLNDPDLFADYEFNVFSGYRINTAFRHTTKLKNGNAISWEYQWDLLKTGGELDRFEMVQHNINFIFHFKSN